MEFSFLSSIPFETDRNEAKYNLELHVNSNDASVWNHGGELKTVLEESIHFSNFHTLTLRRDSGIPKHALSFNYTSHASPPSHPGSMLAAYTLLSCYAKTNVVACTAVSHWEVFVRKAR